MRLYTISIPYTEKKWETTNCIAAIEFVHSFGLAGFGLYSKFIPDQKPIDSITVAY